MGNSVSEMIGNVLMWSLKVSKLNGAGEEAYKVQILKKKQEKKLQCQISWFYQYE